MLAPDPELVRELGRVLAPERVLTRPLDLLGRSVDASIYRLIPRAVVRPKDLHEVQGLLAWARERRRALTFRTAGTSLSGQAVTDDILVELAPFWKAVRVLDGGRRVWTQPGVVGGYINRLLAPLGYRLGPDPASIDAAMMGGILSNNSSGMCCGVALNSYHTLEAITLVLADGTVVDTSRPEADHELRRARPDLHRGLGALRDEVRGDPELVARIRRRFSRKNTTGYSINAFLDHDRPVEILAHLVIGSEGTLAFIANATLRTIPEPPARATGLLYFGELVDAGAAVAPLVAAGAAALEIMDAASLVSQQDERQYPFAVGERTAALLAEFREADAPALQGALARAGEALAGFRLLAPPDFSTDPVVRDSHWRLRKGLFPSVGGMRPSGTAVLIEDIAVPVERLAEAVTDLRILCDRHGFLEAIIFGHARDGNLHFVFAQDFARAETVARYGAFMRELVDLVVGKYDGSLKAEHGTGRNVAPFVRDEWGDQAYAVMQRLKRLIDPQGVLNPGVLLNDDPDVHLKALKPLPPISPTADRCMECGFCEPRCPSRDLTLTPRQRIVLTRAMTALKAQGTPEALATLDEIEKDFAYEGDATCARDSMCSTSCPVKIDTGTLIKEMRALTHPPSHRRLARFAAEHFRLTALVARAGLAAAAAARAVPAGPRLLEVATRMLHRLGPGLVPCVPRDLPLPRPARRLPRPIAARRERRVVYFPSCLSRIIGALPGEREIPLPRAMLDVLQAAGYSVTYPEGLGGLCCGMPFGSKAFVEAAQVAGSRTAEALWTATREGTDPVVTDASPCAGTLREGAALLAASGRVLRTMDFPVFWAREVLPGLERPGRRPGTAVLHPTCTLVKMGALPDLLRVARAHCENVVVPPGAECCGFAGDRGFLVPELTRAATAREASEVRAMAPPPDGLFSTCRTCEIGVGRAVGRPYRSLVHLVREGLLGG
ncbi:MAG TPA: FAD-binding and (Fe-S)-binding domain-containing protein [Vicinamibacteria bacterium]|nr:FAD-binding and (Fe-S)-binding domain-containing protein [Vicinamibacteria bacterium]